MAMYGVNITFKVARPNHVHTTIVEADDAHTAKRRAVAEYRQECRRLGRDEQTILGTETQRLHD